jgi:hypothetical protein
VEIVRYKTLDSQTVTVSSDTGEYTVVAVKVEFSDLNFNHVKVFKLNPSKTDQEILSEIVTYGNQLKLDKLKNRKIEFEGTI